MKQEILNTIKDTVGYNEAENKQSFMIGAQVALSKASDLYETKIKELETNVEYWKRSYELIHADITNVSTILNNYKKYEE